MNNISDGLLSGIRVKMIFYFVLLFIATMISIELVKKHGIPFTPIEGEYKMEQEKVFKNLNLLADLKKERLFQWIEEKKNDAVFIAENAQLKSQVVLLKKVIQENIKGGKADSSLWDEIKEHDAFRTITAHLKHAKKTYSMYDALDIVDPLTGSVIVSSRDTILGKNIVESESLLRSFNYSDSFLNVGLDPVDNEIDLHIYAHIKDKSKTIAIVVFTIHNRHFIEPLLHTGSGMGETGEALLVDSDVRILTSLKHPLANGSIAEPLKFKIKAKPAEYAARGEEGIIESLDYRGVPVLAAYRHIRIMSESGWGMVVKQDVSEIFAPYKKASFYSGIVTLLGAFFISTFTLLITRNITRPVLRLSRIAEMVGKGDLKQRAEDISSDEIGTLAVSFNRMVDNLVTSKEENETKDWFKSGQNKLSSMMRGDQGIIELADNIITFLAEYTGAKTGAFYLVDKTNQVLNLTGRYAFSSRDGFNNRIGLKEGLTGQAVHSRKTIILSNIPEDNIRISSATIDAVPRNLIIIPVVYESESIGVIELGAFREFSDTEQDFLESVMESIAIGINSANSRAIMTELLENSQAQAVKLESQQEELRVSNEELGERTQELEASEEELKTQQEELQTTNEELEEKTFALEKQQEEVLQKNLKLKETQKDLEKQTKELEITGKYKSEFLANMSHELRTPLNSLLVLAQYLFSNKDENLNSEQLEATAIIQSSGEDLLNLINDILDLSKIEAGRMSINIEKVILSELAGSISANFKHLTYDKGLELAVTIDEALPASIRTDQQRFVQIIRNLISNAIKFTNNGSIKVDFRRPSAETDLLRSGLEPEKSIAVLINDTGIGIPEDKHSEVFEAFQQVDGSTSRQFGGTGLGLSISRELVKLLGGEIQLRSVEGKGSTFTIYLPEELHIESETVDLQTVRVNTPPTNNIEPRLLTRPAPSIKDDRDDIKDNDKTLLLIEDDLNFAEILYKFGHERGFKCIHSGDGETGLKLSLEYKPDAIILDMKLPGIKGWDVLETLKSNPLTRHIPVHIMSVMDEKIDAYQSGAIGYIKKPVNMEQIQQTFTKIEDLISRTIKKLLVVEDNEVLRKHIVELIGNSDVKVHEVTNGNDAIEEIKSNKYDCVILDLKLPDISGFEVLKILDESEAAIPPVIIYTGRELTREEEYKLQEYASSIIIKGVRSEERLLDETALFLHRVVDDLPQNKKEMISRLYDVEAIFKGKKILLADDDMRNVFAVSKVLEAKGMDVHKAADGEKALAVLDEMPDMDLVLMDIMMPVMDGYETIDSIRSQERFRKLPIIAITAKAMKEDFEKCISAGANDYLPKPIKIEKLLSLMRVWLYGKQGA